MISSKLELGPHEKYLDRFSETDFRRRLEPYRVTVGPLDESPLIVCGDKPGSQVVVKPNLAKWEPRFHPLDPVSLDDIKNWFGIPNESARQMMKETRVLYDGGNLWTRASQVRFDGLEEVKKFDFAVLNSAHKRAIKRMAYSLLYGYVSAEEMERPEVQYVVEYMIDQVKARKPRMLVASNLIVCPDQEVIFQDVPVIFFNSVLVYGNGKITTRGHIKIDAHQIRRIG